MRKIFFDTMLLIYLLEGNPTYSRRMQEILTVAYQRKDQLLTSFFALGEVMAGAAKSSHPSKPHQLRTRLEAAGFSYLEFGDRTVSTFAHIRSTTRVKAPDAINLACAAAAKVDLFLTGDKNLHRLYIPGIQFIVDFDTPFI